MWFQNFLDRKSVSQISYLIVVIGVLVTALQKVPLRKGLLSGYFQACDVQESGKLALFSFPHFSQQASVHYPETFSPQC